MSLAELVVDLAVKTDTFKVKDFSKAMWEVPLSAAATVASLAGVSLSFLGLTNDIMHMTTGLKVFTSETGLNDKALQQWQQTAKEFGLSGDVGTGFINRIAQLQAGIKINRPDVNALMMLGQLGVTDMGGSAYDVANRIQASAGNKDRITAMGLLGGAGFDQSIMRLFDLPMEKREHLPVGLTASNENSVAAFQKALSDFNTSVIGHFAPVLEKAIPPMIKFADSLNSLMDFFTNTKIDPGKFMYDLGHGTRQWMDDVVNDGRLHDRTLRTNVITGDTTYNIVGLTHPEEIARRINEEKMRKETVQRTMIQNTFNNNGPIP